jgi:hypothetical protein
VRGWSLVLLSLLACAPTTPGPDVIARADFVAACARVRACVPDPASVPSLSECAELAAAQRASSTSAYRCANAANADCAAILACLAGPVPVSECSAADAPACVDAHDLGRCLGGTPFVTGCAEGESCIAANAASGIAGCGRQACGETYVPTCEGERILRCAAGVLVAEACASGARCVPAASEGAAATCVGEGAACTPDQLGGTHCDGTRLTSCVGGREAVRDCRAEGVDGTCQTNVDAPSVCVGAGGECAGAGFADRCNGTRLEYCLDGTIAGVDCAQLGFAACDLGTPDRGVPARCAGGGS